MLPEGGMPGGGPPMPIGGPLMPELCMSSSGERPFLLRREAGCEGGGIGMCGGGCEYPCDGCGGGGGYIDGGGPYMLGGGAP